MTSVEDKMRDVTLTWFGHIRWSMSALVRRCERIILLECRRGRGRPRKSWNEVIRHGLKTS